MSCAEKMDSSRKYTAVVGAWRERERVRADFTPHRERSFPTAFCRERKFWRERERGNFPPFRTRTVNDEFTPTESLILRALTKPKVCFEGNYGNSRGGGGRNECTNGGWLFQPRNLKNPKPERNGINDSDLMGFGISTATIVRRSLARENVGITDLTVAHTLLQRN